VTSIEKRTSLLTPSGARVPPAWTNVWITQDVHSPLQATGRDSKGRRVYLYSTEHMGKAAAAKFSRLREFNKVYPRLIKRIERDMKTSEEAFVLYLIAKTGFRIGSKSETLAEVKALGASTLQCSNLTIDGNKVSFDFTGKKGIEVNKVLENRSIASDIALRCNGPSNKAVFKTTDDEIRKYLKSVPGGSGFMVKDFRTYLATTTALRKINVMPLPKNKREYRSYRRRVGEVVAKKLGNSPTIALNSYVAPEVFCPWQAPLPSHEVIEVKNRAKVTEFFDCVHYDQDIPKEES
jgi:DNA topoisomerase-1